MEGGGFVSDSEDDEMSTAIEISRKTPRNVEENSVENSVENSDDQMMGGGFVTDENSNQNDEVRNHSESINQF